MKTSLLFVLLGATAVSATAQQLPATTPPDTLWTIHIQLHDDPLRGKNRVLHYKYRETVYRYPRQRKAFVNDLLVPLVEKSGNPAAQESLATYFRVKRGKAVLGYLWLGANGVGVGFMYSAMIKTFASAFSQKEDPTIQREITTGWVLMGAGWASGIIYLTIASRPKRFLHQSINEYNATRNRWISWRVLPAGTGLRLVGKF